MFNCCNQTVAATPHLLRCWLYTTELQGGYWPKPFQLPGKPRIQQKYQAFWKQFLCFAFRAWSTGSASGLQRKVYGHNQFFQRQLALILHIWAYLDSLDGSPSSRKYPVPGEPGNQFWSCTGR